MNNLYNRALEFATKAHGEQKRKYSGEPYIVHPVAVAAIVAQVTNDEEMIAAALLHDVVEDTKVTLDGICYEFGERVALLVDDLTDVSKPEHGNRARRRAIDRAHTAAASPDAKTIKLADLLHNTSDICQHDPDFAVVYMREKEQVLPFLKQGNAILYRNAMQAVADYKASRASQ
jgi:(p)ppGpp synthase/HD superfamily hydrolase